MGTPGMAAVTAGHRRHLAQLGGSGPQLSTTGAVLSNAAAPASVATGYALELKNVVSTVQARRSDEIR